MSVKYFIIDVQIVAISMQI